MTFQTEITGTVLEKGLFHYRSRKKQNFCSGSKARAKSSACPRTNSSCGCFSRHSLPKQAQIQLLTDQLQQHEQWLQRLHGDLSKFDTISARCSTNAAFSDYLVLLGAISREKSMCDWLQTCIELCERNPVYDIVKRGFNIVLEYYHSSTAPLFAELTRRA